MVDDVKEGEIDNVSDDKKEESDEVSFSINTDKIKTITTKYGWVLLMLIPIILTIFIRLQPAELVPLENAAESNVYNFYRTQIINEVNSQFPNLPEGQKTSLADQKLAEILKSDQSSVIKQQIDQSAANLKSHLEYTSGKNTYVYLGDIDSYYWLRMSRNILEKGSQCDVEADDRCYDTYTLAPIPLEKPIDYYPVAIVYNYKFLKIFNPDISLMQASFLTPMMFSILLIIPLFLLLRKIGGNFTALVGTVLVSVNPTVLSRSLGSDSDIVNVFFQAFILWLAIECFYSRDIKKKTAWAIAVAAVLAIYSKFWAGWWYLADLFLLSLAFNVIFIMAHHWYVHRKINFVELKKPIINTSIVAGSFVLTIFIIYGLILESVVGFFYMISNQLGVLHFKVAANPNLWPNVLTTVAEFNRAGISQIINSFGSYLGMSLFLMAMLGAIFIMFPNMNFIRKNYLAFAALLLFNVLVYYFIMKEDSGNLIFLMIIPLLVGMYAHLREKEELHFHPDAIFMLILLISLVFYFSMIGIRFIFLMAIPVMILASIFFVRLSKIITSFILSMFSIPKWVSLIVISVLCYLFVIGTVQAGISTAQNYLPNVNDQWVASLEKIKAESRQDSIINSWWDFGHWFKYWADRRVTLDGSSQNNPQLHWLGKLLLTDDEDRSRAILRMLDCGGNEAFNSINEVMNDTPHSIDILNNIMMMDKKSAASQLKKHGFQDLGITEVLNYIHCDAPENFLITSEDMIGKSGVWAHVGSWDFKRSYLSSVYSSMPEEKIIEKFNEDYEIDSETVRSWINDLQSFDNEEKVNAWIAPWPTYITSFNSCQNTSNKTICPLPQGNNQALPVQVDFNTHNAFVENAEGKRVYMSNAAFVEGDSFVLVEYQNETMGAGIVVVKSPDGVKAVFMAPELTGSMFTRLFLLDAAGLKNFDRFYDATSVFGDRIITWKVRWQNETSS